MRLNDTAAFTVGDKIELECELVNETMSVRWFQNGREITQSKRCVSKANGTICSNTLSYHLGPRTR